jgi:hypothetical protein
MSSRLALVALTIFWVAMNVLLWRAEYGPREATRSAVPAEAVWQKILTAPDSSSLGILHKGKKIGFCHWVTGIGEEWSRVKADEDVPVEGMAGRISGYRVRVDGNLSIEDFASRVRFEGELRLTTDYTWQEFAARLSLRPQTWELASSAREQTLKLHMKDDTGEFDRTFTFAELQNPEALLREFAGPLASGLFSGLGLSLPAPGQRTSPGAALRWEARSDTMQIGHAPMRVYRLQTRLLNRYPVTVITSRVGEILRVELPNEIVLAHDQLANY